jgi:deazaflavin-dependent oxidoreductase (nitroreductase family)
MDHDILTRCQICHTLAIADIASNHFDSPGTLAEGARKPAERGMTMHEASHHVPSTQHLLNCLRADGASGTGHSDMHRSPSVLSRGHMISCRGDKLAARHMEGEIISIKARHAFMRAVDRLTQAAFHLSGGRIGGRQLKYTILLLQTTGRRSGKTRTHALLYVRDGERYVVCGSNFGAPHHPAWYGNLRAEPHVWLQVRRQRMQATAAIATGEERERLWQRLVQSWPFYTNYQMHIRREIPVIILTPLGDSDDK